MPLRGSRVLILGAGGAARAVAFALAQAGAAVCVCARRQEKAKALAQGGGRRSDRVESAEARVFRCDCECHAGRDASVCGRSPLEARDLNCRLVFDTIYRPRKTKLLQLAERRGIETVSGVEMFVAQGAAQWEIWTGQRAPVRDAKCGAKCAELRENDARRSTRGEIDGTEAKMIQPDFKTFRQLARQGNLVPVYETYTADLLTPVGAYLRLAHEAKYSFLLESVEGGENIARYTFVGANPNEVFRARGRTCTLEGEGKSVQFDDDPDRAVLRRLTARYHPVRVPGLPPLIAGAIGYFAYDMVRLVEHIPATGRDDLGLDDCVMMFYLGLSRSITCGTACGSFAMCLPTGEGSLRAKYDAAVREIQRTRRKLEGPLPPQQRKRESRTAARWLEHDEGAVHGRGAQSEEHTFARATRFRSW